MSPTKIVSDIFGGLVFCKFFFIESNLGFLTLGLGSEQRIHMRKAKLDMDFIQKPCLAI